MHGNATSAIGPFVASSTCAVSVAVATGAELP